MATPLRTAAARLVRPAVGPAPARRLTAAAAAAGGLRAPDDNFDVPRPIPLGSREEQREFEEALVRP